MENAQTFLEQIERERKQLGFSPTEDLLWSIDYERKPVGIREFVDSDEYLGSVTRDLQERWKEELDEIFAPGSRITTLIFTGAIGTGKTTVATICLIYKIYLLSCLRDPAEFYGLLPGSKIVFGCFNITLSKADVGYDLFKHYVDSSPYFSKYFPRLKRPDEPIYFPSKKIVYDIGSLSTHALGENMLGFMIDEANFFKKTPDPTQKSRAHQLFLEARTRLISRFMRYGRVPGLVIIISSRKTQTSFLEEQLALVEKDAEIRSTTKVVSMALWEAKPKNIFSGEKFRVVVGDESTESRILEEDEVVKGQVIDVPIEYKIPFVEDITGGLMNIAGISVVGSYSFISNRSTLFSCVDPTRVHPFDSEEVDDVIINAKDPRSRENRFVQDHLLVRKLCYIQNSVWVPRLNPGVKRFAHVDLGVINDAVGLSVGHAVYDNNGNYRVNLDIILRIKAPLGFEVDLEQVPAFFIYLRKLGFMFEAITFDRFEARMAIQKLLKSGFNSFYLSITLDHYKVLRKMLFEGRISYYYYQPFIDEAIELRRAEDPTMRPNHPPGLHDDVIDSVAGVVAHCSGFEKIADKNKVKKPKIESRGPILFG